MIIATVVKAEPSCLKRRKKDEKNKTINTLRPIKISELCIILNIEHRIEYTIRQFIHK